MSGGFILSLFRRKKKKSDEEEPNKKSDEAESSSFGNARVFKYEELKKATKSFTTELDIGGLGSVYHGTLRDGQMVAVRVLHNNSQQLPEQFVNEVRAVSRLRHKNLVTLHGCANPRGKELLLVYEYVPNGTVEDHLHGGRSDLTLAVRVQIAVETAEALVYLHSLDPPVVHQNMKTSNIMLDHAFHAKVGNLSMRCLWPWDTTRVETVPQGTMGYRDPEYDRIFKFTVKSDVYTFGVVLIELISGKKAVDVNRGPDGIYLVDLALDKIINNNLDDFIDPKFGHNSDLRLKRAINLLAKLAYKCLYSTGFMRPTMKQVLTELKQIDELRQGGGLNAPLQELDDNSLVDVSLGRKKTDEEEPTNFGLVRVFQYEELRKATNSFSRELGIGGFGSVYLGTLRDGQKVAVKLLHNNSPKRFKEFITELMVLSNLRHDNLVNLRGCTDPRGRDLLLVYEYVPNGTVEEHLHDQRSDLTIAVRVQIAVETAEALVYLHAHVPPLIHRDVKPSNIMLDHDFHVKVGDFGMSRLLPWDATQVISEAQGTLGYRDPEYDRTLVLTVKSDVYSFGVLVLELISGKKAVDVNRAPDNIYLAGLALDKINNEKLDDFVDPNIGYNSNVSVKRTINSLAKLACKCLHSTGIMRPTMEQVITELKHIKDELQQIGGLNELGDDSLIDGKEATIEDPDNGASIYGLGKGNISLLDNKSLSFDIKDLMTASVDVMGKGNFGTTNRATLESGAVVIVKRLMCQINDLSKKVFSQQMQLLQQMKHGNLVEIINFSDSKDEMLIIYENVPGASLYKRLHDYRGAGEGPLNWAARLSIVKGMARGLAYLHDAPYSPKLLHANLKSSNVLVVQDKRRHPATYRAKLTDFGFLPFLESAGQASKLAIASTPELLQVEELSQKADVYCFGLVLLEVITGKAPDKVNLRERVISTPEDIWTKILDLEIAAEVDGREEEMRTLIKIALECTSTGPDRRPEMSELVQVMEEIGEPDR